MKVEDIRIGSIVFAHNKELRSIYEIVVKEITSVYDKYFIGGYNNKGVKVLPVYSDCVFSTKEEAINSYLTDMNKEIISVITSL